MCLKITLWEEGDGDNEKTVEKHCFKKELTGF